MIKIVITKTTTEEYTAVESTIIEETPTDKFKKSAYGNDNEMVMAKKWAPIDVRKTRTATQTLLEQEIYSEELFNLGDVIKAINGL